MSPKTNRSEMVFARDLTEPLAANLIYKIMNHGPWQELSTFIETHEGSTFSYLVKGNSLQGSIFRIELLVKTTQ